jgi:hypothetical protein
MESEIKGKKLILTLDLQKPEVSKSGKSMIVATTNGFVKTSLEVGGKQVSVAVNCIIKP